MAHAIASEFCGRALLPEHTHDGFCFLDLHDVQQGPSFSSLSEAVAWVCAQSDDTLVRIVLVPEGVLVQ